MTLALRDIVTTEDRDVLRKTLDTLRKIESRAHGEADYHGFGGGFINDHAIQRAQTAIDAIVDLLED